MHVQFSFTYQPIYKLRCERKWKPFSHLKIFFKSKYQSLNETTIRFNNKKTKVTIFSFKNVFSRWITKQINFLTIHEFQIKSNVTGTFMTNFRKRYKTLMRLPSLIEVPLPVCFSIDSNVVPTQRIKSVCGVPPLV